MAISAVNNIKTNYEQLSTMKKLNSVKDNPAGLAILEGLKSQTNGYDVGASNAETAKDMLKVADGGLSGITDSLQRMRELSIQAGNAAYTDDDRQAIQDEIESLKQGINQSANNTEFNTKKLLNGSQGNIGVAVGPDGSTKNISTGNATLDALGLSDYSVMGGSINVSKIDDALKMISEQRGSIGANSNALDSTIAYNKLASENLMKAGSNIEDVDVGKAVSDLKKNQVMEEYRMFAQSAKQNQAQGALKILSM